MRKKLGIFALLIVFGTSACKMNSDFHTVDLMKENSQHLNDSEDLTDSQAKLRNILETIKNNDGKIFSTIGFGIFGGTLGYLLGGSNGAIVGGALGSGTGMAIGYIFDNLERENQKFDEAAALSAQIIQEQMKIYEINKTKSILDNSKQLNIISQDRIIIEEIIEQNTKTLAEIEEKLNDKSLDENNINKLINIKIGTKNSLNKLISERDSMSKLYTYISDENRPAS